jgi:hypothetical protein
MPCADQVAEIERHAKERETRHKEPCNGSGFECELEPVGERSDRGLGGTHIGPHRHVHADEARSSRENRANQKPDRNQPAEEIAKDQKNHDADDADGGVLALEIGLSAFAYGR